MSPQIDREEMKNYLLGTLEADRRTALEERILVDPAVYEELLVIEEELIEQYVTGCLSNEEKHQFETHFLITAERQKRLRFGQLLKRYINSHPSLVPHQNSVTANGPVREAPANNLLPIYLGPFTNRPALTLALSVALIISLGLLFVCLLAAKRPAEGIAQHISSEPLLVKLAPGAMRSGGTTNRIPVPPKGVDVKLELEVTNTSFRKYKSQLFRESESVETFESVEMESKGEQHIVPVTIRGEILSPGDYQVRLSGVLDSGVDEFIDNYSFRVTAD